MIANRIVYLDEAAELKLLLKELTPKDEATSRFLFFLCFGANCSGRGAGDVGLSSQEIALKRFFVSLFTLQI